MIKLTERAAQHFADMGDAADDAQDRVRALQRRVDEIERQIRNGGADPDGLGAELTRQRGRLEAAQETFAALSRSHTAVGAWVKQLRPDTRLDDVDLTLWPTLQTHETHVDAVVRIRCDIEDLIGDRSALRRALLPLDELFAQSDAHVDALARQGAPRLRLDGDRLTVQHEIEGFADKAVALLAWLHPEQMKERLREDIRAHREREIGDREVAVLSTTERAQKMRELDDNLLERERCEEALIREADAEGTVILRREKASPLAVLGVRVA
jgi:hypothetical protein